MPTWLINAKTPLALQWVIDMREIFARDEEVDAEERQTLTGVMLNSEQIYTAEETMTIDRVKAKFQALEEEKQLHQSPSTHEMFGCVRV